MSSVEVAGKFAWVIGAIFGGQQAEVLRADVVRSMGARFDPASSSGRESVAEVVSSIQELQEEQMQAMQAAIFRARRRLK